MVTSLGLYFFSHLSRTLFLPIAFWVAWNLLLLSYGWLLSQVDLNADRQDQATAARADLEGLNSLLDIMFR